MQGALPLLLVAALAAAPAPLEPAPTPPGPAAPRCPPSDEACCRYIGFTGHEHLYTVHNSTDSNFLVLFNGRELVLKCTSSGLSLDDACMPRFSSALSVARLTLAGCLPGAGGSLAGALRAHGVQARPLRQLELRLPRAAPLSTELLAEPDQFAELQMLALIALSGTTLPTAAAAALARLSSLSSLHLTGVLLPTNTSLPRSLQTLRLEGACAEVTREQLEHLPALTALSLRDKECHAPPPLAGARALRFATIEAPLDGLPELHAVENITFRGASSLQWYGGCGSLRRLRVVGGAGAPPAGWLAHCPALQALALVARGLSALPADLLDYTPSLRALDISSNKLTYLDSGMLQRVTHLQELDASRNALTAGVVAVLRSLPALRVLVLDSNPLGDLCADDGRRLTVPVLSPLAELAALQRLALAATGARRVCADWARRLPALTALDLSRNNVTQLREVDLQWTVREKGAKGVEGVRGVRGAARLDLRGNPLRALRLRRADYLQLPEEAQPVNVVVLIDSALECDCEAYWLVRALRERRLPAELRARCAPRAPHAAASLQQVPLKDMTCPIEESAGCPRDCRCAWHAHDNTTDAWCSRVHALPDTRALPTAVRLHVLDGRLDALPAVLSANIVLLDVSGNNISDVSAAAGALLSRGRRVRLARNPLRCACAHRALLHALAAHRAQVEDYEEVKCNDGRWVGDTELLTVLTACDAGSGPAPALVAAGVLLALAAAAAAGVALALRRSTLWRLKVHEMARALCPAFCLDSEPDEDSKYDVFLSFAHGDRDPAERIVRVLETPPRALRVCLHSRDWRAGDWIPAQIAHSVAVSRRTVVLLSERFARSRWARAELRLAAARALRDARPRLLVVLLDARPPRLDPELARYVATHTYLSYSDPHFWDKLRRALPEPQVPRADRRPLEIVPAPADDECAKKIVLPDIQDKTKAHLAIT